MTVLKHDEMDFNVGIWNMTVFIFNDAMNELRSRPYSFEFSLWKLYFMTKPKFLFIPSTCEFIL